MRIELFSLGLGLLLGSIFVGYIKYQEAHSFEVYVCGFTTQQEFDEVKNDLFKIQKSPYCVKYLKGFWGSVPVQVINK